MCRRRIVETSDVRLTPRCAAAPRGPPITQFVSASARRMCSRSASSSVTGADVTGTPVSNSARDTVSTGPRDRITDHERPQVAVLVEEIEVHVIVRDDARDVRCDRRPELGQVTLGHDGIRDLDQRPPVIALRLEVGAALML